MDRLSDASALQLLPKVLADLVEGAVADVRVQASSGVPPLRADALVWIAGHRFLVEYKAEGTLVPVVRAIESLQQTRGELPDALPLVVVPYMEPSGRLRCREEGVSWCDLSGNADIRAPGLVIRVEGRPNRYRRRGRPADIFAPKSSRVARFLLSHPDRSFSQREISSETGLGEGYVSRIVGHVENLGVVSRSPDGRVRLLDGQLLLDAWKARYDFRKHFVLRGHVASRTPEQLMHQVARTLTAQRSQYALTGLAAAWTYLRFAAFQIVTFYVAESPEPNLLEALGFREEPSGANVWLVVPNDEGVFMGTQQRAKLPCVSPLQVYLDLGGHPERAAEAAEELRRSLLPWTLPRG